MKLIYCIISILLLVSCNEANQRNREYVDSLNIHAYNIRYIDIDSTRRVATEALDKAGDYSEGKARALNLLVYVDYQQMDFSSAFHKLDSINNITNNQIILLVSDVLRMKINQRIGDGMAFFEARSSAQKRMNRAIEEFDLLRDVDLHDFNFARTEYHIISSTYYYYQEQQKEAIEEMNAIADDFVQVSDSTQWLYYNYMLGSGGLIKGPSDEVLLKEFDHLMLCWGYSRGLKAKYFEANSLQALASMLSKTENRDIIIQERPDLYRMLLNQHQDWLPQSSEDMDEFLPEALALHAVYGFRQYKDLFQTACAYRTLGEMAFDQGLYELALENYEMALDCVNEQFINNNSNESIRLLSLYDDGFEGEADVELSWIDSDSIYTVPEWIAGIRQRISMAYSALGMTDESDFNRNIYLDIIARTSQNVEMEGRKAELQKETYSLKVRLIITSILFSALVSLIIFLAHRLRKSNETRFKAQQNSTTTNDESSADALRLQAIQDETEEFVENCNLYELKIDKNKRKNAEKRAKVSLVHAVTPFLDRILNQIVRMKREGHVDKDKLDYVIELTDRIVTYNEILTDWIKMEKGELSLQIGTINLDKIFQTIKRGHYAFDQKGVTLNVESTDCLVKADEALTLFMLNTLADNARKFTPEGGSVTVSATPTDSYVELSVTDTGCGICEKDVEQLNNNKVYDSSKIGAGKEGKGFGFGIMNCRGIIEKYKKTSSIFQCCEFHVESELGKGSRFSFRLPRVILSILLILSFQSLSAGTKSITEYYENAFNFNQSQEYEKAIDAAIIGLHSINPHLVISKEDETKDDKAVNEIDLFLKGDTLPYQSAISLRNELARAALALNLWDIYRYNNSICTKLYKLYHQDQSLPTYCEELEQTQTTSRQLLMLLVLFSISVIILCLILLQRRISVRRVLAMQHQLCAQLEHVDENFETKEISDLKIIIQDLLQVIYDNVKNWYPLEGIRVSLCFDEESEVKMYCIGETDGMKYSIQLTNEIGSLEIFGPETNGANPLGTRLTQTIANVLNNRVVKIYNALNEHDSQLDKLNHLQYEENRIYVQNQILDNCLSTIKHESMYYPSRIQQLAQRMMSEQTDDIEQLSELSTYYKEVYTLLSNQADKLVMHSSYRSEYLEFQHYVDAAVRHFNKIAKKKGVSIRLIKNEIPNVNVRADNVLMEELFHRFNATFIDWYSCMTDPNTDFNPSIDATCEDNILKCTYHLAGIYMDETETHNLFYPEAGKVNLLVCKQIIRELDALSNFPGLRLIAQSTSCGTDIMFSLVLQSTKHQTFEPNSIE